MTLMQADDPVAVATVQAIQAGDLDALGRLLAQGPGLVGARIVGDGGARSPLGLVTDWPGRRPRGGAMVELLVGAGADVNAPCMEPGPHRETPLHWAASCDDLDVLDALLDAGAAIDAPGAVIAGGAPLDDAVAFAQWAAARRLVERGATVAVWHAAALGLLDLLRGHFAGAPLPARFPWGASSPAGPPRELDVAFWCACHGGQLAAAELLLARGADPSWRSPWDGLAPLDVARRSRAGDVEAWLRGRGARGARGSRD